MIDNRFHLCVLQAPPQLHLLCTARSSSLQLFFLVFLPEMMLQILSSLLLLFAARYTQRELWRVPVYTRLLSFIAHVYSYLMIATHQEVAAAAWVVLLPQRRW
jgi:hypothetical protein